MSEMETCSGTSFGISPPEQSSLMSVSPMSIQINDSLLVTRLETAHSEPEISHLDDEIDESACGSYNITGASPMSITPESHHSPSAELKRRENLKLVNNDFPSSSSPVLLHPTNSGDSFYKPSNNTLKLPPFAQFISNRTA